MDSKRTYKKISTWFWWILTALPVLIILGYIISSILNFNTQGGTPVNASTMQMFWNSIGIEAFFDSSTIDDLQLMIPDDLNTAMYNLLRTLGVEDKYFFTILSWGIAVQFYHVIFDIMVWLPHKMHEVMER